MVGTFGSRQKAGFFFLGVKFWVYYFIHDLFAVTKMFNE